jgi:hypothetical protein
VNYRIHDASLVLVEDDQHTKSSLWALKEKGRRRDEDGIKWTASDDGL